LGRDTNGGQSPLTEVEFQQGTHVTRYLDVAKNRAAPGDQLWIISMHGDADGPSVRTRPGNRSQTDRMRQFEFVDNQIDRGQEAIPLIVGLRSVEQQEVTSGFVDDSRQRNLWILHRREVITGEGHSRTTRPVVDQLIGVEGRNQFGLARIAKVSSSQPHSGTGIDEALKSVHQRRQ
jgi:hypothetical protein